MNSRPVHILLVEDSPSDARLTLEALKQGKLTNDVFHVENGELAIDYLRRQGEFCDVARPHLVILDLNMPRKNGLEVLAEIRADDELKCIPVVVLTTSENENDIQKAYSLNANCYIAKPVDLDDFIRVVQHIDSFWLNIAKLPPTNY